MTRQERTLKHIPLRELLENMGNDIITWNDGSVLIGKLLYVHPDKNDYNLIAGVSVRVGREIIQWDEDLWKNAVFA